MAHDDRANLWAELPQQQEHPGWLVMGVGEPIVEGAAVKPSQAAA
eukprot:CAMPEP_0205942516 /NCGR_PEP_ID=MMETSP1325-20131115/57806_1 /ASSEMBLY_ACC=CAM_ASM_000708 /TAXON_ID=236786 /ORGANISM="Florenciella sp., Strain RCC1007" /LENGTH=44 /DNA_ID= /DNA_START= /DNA_END= /DNA_ORIENTATION=